MNRTCKYCNTEKPIEDFSIRKNTLNHYWKCKDCTAKNATLWNKKNSLRRLSIDAATRARTKGVPFDIDWKWVLDNITASCPCCHEPFRLGEPTGRGKKAKDRPSLDRIVPELGYTKDNTRIICTWCNIIKNDGTALDHEMIARWMFMGAPQEECSLSGMYGDGI